MEGDQQTNGQSGPNNDKLSAMQEMAQSSSILMNDLVVSPFISGIVQGFISVVMQRRRERRLEREAAKNNMEDRQVDYKNNGKIDSMDISAKLKDSLLRATYQVNDSSQPYNHSAPSP